MLYKIIFTNSFSDLHLTKFLDTLALVKSFFFHVTFFFRFFLKIPKALSLQTNTLHHLRNKYISRSLHGAL